MDLPWHLPDASLFVEGEGGAYLYFSPGKKSFRNDLLSAGVPRGFLYFPEEAFLFFQDKKSNDNQGFPGRFV